MATRGERLRERWYALKDAFGGKCSECGQTWDLEFAHVRITGVSGMGRGKWKRFYDIKHHPESYRLLCQPHHAAFDGPAYRNRYRREKYDVT